MTFLFSSKAVQFPAGSGEVRTRSVVDRLGVLAAGACAIHCMAAPLVLGLAPAIGSFWASPKTHWAFAAITVPAAASLLWRARRSRWPRRVATAAVMGSLLVLIGLAAPGAEWAAGVGFDVPCGEFLAGLLPAPAETGCTDECCASLRQEAGAPTFFLPIASLVTMCGGLLLSTAHIVSMRCAKDCVPMKCSTDCMD
ncbi:MAG: MerC domain-containing protein [Planctomycetota bacterium]|nr:MerC domain-containing protein [Planctomycetota bacterium]